MHGMNTVRGREGDGTTLQVREVFHTLQGEGPHSGKSAIFVRLTGCNLRCHFCDTKWDDAFDPVRRVDDLAAQVWNEACRPGRTFSRLVVLTGGEPLRQDISQLLARLIRERGLIVQIETAGTLWQDCLAEYTSAELQVIVSPKTPVINGRVRARADAFKYVISTRDTSAADGLPITNTQDPDAPGRILARANFGTPIYLSPCDEGDEELNKSNRALVGRLAMLHGFIAGVQLHKLLDLP